MLSIFLSGVYRQPRGTTHLVASSFEDGHTFQENLTPSRCSGPWKSHCILKSKADVKENQTNR
jgi:hypothetical protein